MATISGNVCNTYVHMDLIVTETGTSVDNNTSTVSWKLVGYLGSGATSTHWYSNSYHTITVEINGATVYSLPNTIQKAISIGTNHTQASPLTIASGTATVAHSSDGTKTCACSFSCVYRYNSAYTWTGTGKVALTTIARATQPTVSVSSANLNTTITISMARASSSFTHTLTYKFGNATGTIGTGLGTSKTWKPPLSLANQIPASLQGTCTITCKTYNGSTLIGTKTTTIILTVPASVVPGISAIRVGDANGYAATYGGYVQKKSKATVNVDTTTQYGATIKTYKIEMNGCTYIQNGCTSDLLTTSGELTITATVTDSRGRTATSSTTITVLEYSAPKITSFKAYRCNSATDTTANEDGAVIFVSHSESISSLNSNNTKTVTVQYQEAEAATWTTLTGNTFEASPDKRYNVKITVTDRIGTTTTAQKEVNSSYTIIDFNNAGKGVAFGKVSENNKFDVNMEALFRKAVDFTGDVSGILELLDTSTYAAGYVKFPHGNLIIQWKTVEVTTTITQELGNIFYNGSAISIGNWAVPMVNRFTSWTFVHGQSASVICWVQQYAAPTTTSAGSCGIYRATSGTTSRTYRVCAVAIGTYAD